MSLNHADSPYGPAGPAPGPKLKVTASVLRERAGKAENVRGQFLKADDEVVLETGQVSGTLKGFATNTAIDTFLERWRGQMSYVKELFTGTAGALQAASETFTTEDTKQGQAAAGVRTPAQNGAMQP
ncbi:hypothetical protein [Streptomyces sp. NPDC003023]|uniref:hypothetical protein n=1 Tax=Streptomyces sp. NPDC003023 TaxID=3364675 RepID=UPI0036BE685C